MSAIGDLIWKTRVNQGVSRQEVADCVGVSYDCIRHIEQGARNPSPANALAIGQALAIAPDDLFGAMPESGENCWWPTVCAEQLVPAPKPEFPPNLETFLIQAGVLV